MMTEMLVRQSFTNTSNMMALQMDDYDYVIMQKNIYYSIPMQKDTAYMIESPHDSSSGIASDDHNGPSYTNHADLDDHESQDSRDAESCDSCAERQRTFMLSNGSSYQNYGNKFSAQSKHGHQFGASLTQKLTAYQQHQTPGGAYYPQSYGNPTHFHDQHNTHKVPAQSGGRGGRDRIQGVGHYFENPPNTQGIPSSRYDHAVAALQSQTYHQQGRLTTFKGPTQDSSSKQMHKSKAPKMGSLYEEVNLDDPYGLNESDQSDRHQQSDSDFSSVPQSEREEFSPKRDKKQALYGQNQAHYDPHQAPYDPQNTLTQDWINNHKNGFTNPQLTLQGLNLQDSEKLIYVTQKKGRISYFDLISDHILYKILANLPSNKLCISARVCRRWYNIAWDPTLWTCIKINNPTINVDKALRSLTRRLSYNTPGVCIMVERINLSGCEQLTDKGLMLVAKRCPELRMLEVQRCPNITNMAMFEVLSRCVNLEHLNTAGSENITCISLTPEATVQAQAYGKQIFLRYLDMTDCFQLEDTGLQIIASYCSQLVFLYLRRCTKLSDIGIQYVANYCTNLREFSISDCKKVTDTGMRELSKLGNNLRYLSVAKCDKVTDIGVKYVARHCQKLRYLNVRGCESVSDNSIELLAQYCSRLKSLDVGKCDVTDDGLEFLAENCPQLKKLSLKSCENITDRGVIVLAQHCRHLQQLNIQDCQLTVEAYRTVKKLCKRCIIEHTNPGFY